MLVFKKLWSGEDVLVDGSSVVLIEGVASEGKEGTRLHLSTGRDVEVKGEPTSAYMKIEESYRIF